MPDVIQLPRVSANLMGTSYPVLTASVDVQINNLMTFSVTITTADARDGGVLTVGMIRKLAAKAQEAIYKTPKESNAILNIGGYKGEALTLEGIINSVNVYATTSGGLACQIGAIANDSLLSCVDYNIYLDYVNTQKASEEIFGTNKDAKTGAVYVMALPQQKRESAADSVAKRMWNLIDCAQSKWQSYSQIDDQPEAIKKAIESVTKINKSATNHIRKFLGRSDKTSHLFNDEVNVNEATSDKIMDGLHNLLFASGLNFLEATFAACSQYELWYLPKLKQKGMGYLENSKFGVENVDSMCKVYCTDFTYNSGNRWYGRPPCNGVVMRAQSYVNATAEGFSVNKTPASRQLCGFYPPKPEKTWGALYVLQAPSYITLPLLSTLETKRVEKDTAEQFKSGTLTSKYSRQKNLPQTLYKNVINKQKPNIKKAGDILTYLAQKEYYRILLSPSTATVSGAFSGAPSAEVGDMVDVQINPSGQVVKGILNSISIRVSADGPSSISYQIVGATISDNMIK